jgi:hypothetical protein
MAYLIPVSRKHEIAKQSILNFGVYFRNEIEAEWKQEMENGFRVYRFQCIEITKL